MLDWIEDIDRSLFLAINGCHNPFFDNAMWLISHKFTWIPLYLILAILAFRKWGWKGLLMIILGVAVTITITDQVSVKLFKNVFERYRPCHNLEIKQMVHLVNDYCGGKFGFVSSHASNHFGLATFFTLTLFATNKKWVIGLLTWAAVICYSRVYLGVHYPADVTVGAFIGIAAGFVMAKVFNLAQQKFT